MCDEAVTAAAGSRRNVALATGALNERGITIAEEVTSIARGFGATPTQLAIAWTLRNPAVTGSIMGAGTLA